MADSSKLDSQFILEINKSQHKGTKDELSFALHRSVRSNKSKLSELETIPPQDLRNHLRNLYQSMYEEDEHFEATASKLLHASIQKMQSHKKHSKPKKKSSIRTIPKKKALRTPIASPQNKPNKANPPLQQEDDAEFVKPKRRQRRKSQAEERFTPSWNKMILHQKIKVYWPLDKRFYRGVVSAINESKQKAVLVKYGDGDKEWLNLQNEQFMFYEISSDDDSSDDNERSGEFVDTDDEEDIDMDNDGDYQIGDKQSEHEHEEGIRGEEDDDDIMGKNRRKIRRKSKKKIKSKKKKKKRKKKKKKSPSKSPKSERKKKKRKEMQGKEMKKKEKMSENEEIVHGIVVNTMDIVPQMEGKIQTQPITPVNIHKVEFETEQSNNKIEKKPVLRINNEKDDTESDKSPEHQRDAMSEDSPCLNKNNMESEEDDNSDDEDSDVIDADKDDVNDSNDDWIDSHVTITIDGDRFDGVVEVKHKGEDDNIFYKIKFDSSNSRESEWVRAEQMERQQTTTCENFQIGDDVEVRENNEWLEVIGKVQQIYQGATGIIVLILFPEFDNVFLYYSQRDVRKTRNVSE